MPQRIFAVIIFTLCFPFALGQDQALLDDQKKMAQLSRLAETQGKKQSNPTARLFSSGSERAVLCRRVGVCLCHIYCPNQQ